MEPSHLAARLRQIADKIDRSKNPNRATVSADLRAVLAVGGDEVAKLDSTGLMNWILRAVEAQAKTATFEYPGREVLVQGEELWRFQLEFDGPHESSPEGDAQLPIGNLVPKMIVGLLGL